MSKAQLKKHLLKLTKEQVVDVVLELYDARKEAKEYLEFYMNPNDDGKLEEYKKIIYNEFYPSRGEPKCRFSVCRKAISDFKVMCYHVSKINKIVHYLSFASSTFRR